jgi:ribosome-associated protein
MKKENSSDAAADEATGFTLPDDSAGFALAELTGWYLLEKKCEDLVLLDLRGRSDVCDFFVLASGQSATQVKALAKHVHNALLAAGHRPKGLEGMHDGRWALLDFFDVVVHVFHAPAREYFQLEKLWGDAPRLDLGPQWYLAAEVAGRHPGLNFTTPTVGDSSAD